MTTSFWLSRTLRLSLYSLTMYSCHLFLISFASVRSLPFLSFIMPILARNIPLVSPIFLKTFLVFSILLFSSISLHCSFKKVFLSPLAILWNSVRRWIYLSLSPLPFSFLFSAICKPPQTTTLLSCIFFLSDGFGHCFLYNVINFCPQCFRHSVYLI